MYDDTIATATDSEQLLGVRRNTESKTLPQTIELEKSRKLQTGMKEK